MKKFGLILFIPIMLSLCACGPDEQTKAVIDKINTIGTVDYDDELLIGEIEDDYRALTTDQRKKVSNYDTLVDARKDMDDLIAKRPTPFGNVNWETTEDELYDVLGKEADENYQNDTWGYTYNYKNMEFDGYPGQVKYIFNDGKLTNVMFNFDEYDAEAINHFEELFTTQYGAPDYDEDSAKRWDEENFSVGIMNVQLFGGISMIVYSSPQANTTE